MAKSSKPRNKTKHNKNINKNPKNSNIDYLEDDPVRDLLADQLEEAIAEITPKLTEQAEIIAQILPKFRSKVVQLQLIQFINFLLHKNAVEIIYKPLIKTYAELNNLSYNFDDEASLRSWFDDNASKIFDLEDEEQVNENFWLLSISCLGKIFTESSILLDKLEVFFKVTNFNECLQVIISAVPYYPNFLESIINNVNKEIETRHFSEFATSVLDHMSTIVQTKEQSELDFPDVNQFVKFNQATERGLTIIQLIRYIFQNA